MTYNFNNKKNKKSAMRAILIFISIFFIFVLVSNTFSARIFSNAAEVAALPFLKIGEFTRSRIEPYRGFFSSKNTLMRDNMSLRARVDELHADLAGYDLAIQEVLELKKLFGGAGNSSLRLAGVLSRSFLPMVDTFIIDVGIKNDIQEGDLVFAQFSQNGGEDSTPDPERTQRILIGKVSEAFSSSAKVKLFSSAGEKTEVFLGPSDILVTLTGKGGGVFEADIPEGADVEDGDIAVLPGIEEYIVGEVADIAHDESVAFRKVHLRTIFNPHHIRYVAISASNRE